MAELSRGQILKNPEVVSGVSGVGATVRLQDGDKSAYIDIKTPDVVGTAYTLTLPGDDGSANQVLKTDGSGNLSFSAVPASGSNTQLQYNSSGSFAGAAVTTDSNNLYFNAGSGAIFKDNVDLYSQIRHSATSNIDGVNNLIYNLPEHVGLGGSVLKVTTNPVNGVHTLHWAPDLLGEFLDVGGGDGAVQYNAGGIFGGSSNFTFDVTQNIVRINGNLFVGDSVTPGLVNTNIGVGTFTSRVAIGTNTFTSSGEVLQVRTRSTTNADAAILSFDGAQSLIFETLADGVPRVTSSTNLRLSGSTFINLETGQDVRISTNRELRFLNSSNTQFGAIRFNNASSDYAITLPATDGIQDDILQRDGSGNMQWVDNRRVFNASFTGGNNPIGAGSTVFLTVPNDCTIIEARLITNRVGSMTVIVERATFATTPTYSDISNGGIVLAAASGEAVQNTTLTSWTTSLNRGDILRFRVTGAPLTATNATASLIVRSR